MRIQFSSSAPRVAVRTERTYPRDETLVETIDTTTSPDGPEGLYHGLRAVRRHLRLDDFEGLPERCDFELKGRVCSLRKSTLIASIAVERVPCS